MKLQKWRDRIARGLLRLIAHIICLYSCLAMTLNSTWSGSLFDLTVNPLFSGAIHWERVSWGPLPWNIRIKNPQLIDAGGIEVARFETFEVRDYNLFGLTEYTYGAQFVGLYNGHFNLHQRPHTDDPSQLIWNIEELFKPPHSIHKLDDGELVPPVLVQLNHCELEGIRGRVKMGTVDVSMCHQCHAPSRQPLKYR